MRESTPLLFLPRRFHRPTWNSNNDKTQKSHESHLEATTTGPTDGPFRRRNGQNQHHSQMQQDVPVTGKGMKRSVPTNTSGRNNGRMYFQNWFRDQKDRPNDDDAYQHEKHHQQQQHQQQHQPQQPQQHHNFSMKQRLSNTAKFMKEIIPSHHNFISICFDDGYDDDDDDDDDENRNGNKHNYMDHTIYYQDNFNDLPWKCSFGTSEENGVWMNTSDTSGIIMSSMVWLMILYSGFTVTILAKNNSLNSLVAIIYCTLCALALGSHAKTTLTDPGSIPQSAVPTQNDGINNFEFPMCSVCQSYKPKNCHHCRICNRCISGMDHHCPWMNNCIGKGNLKHFILFLGYVWLASTYALILFGLNYFLCTNEECTFPDVLIQLVRIMTVLCIGALCFTSSMILNIKWGIMTGLGTIDRLKEEELNIKIIAEEAPIPWKNVFGIQHRYTWFLPIDPVFDDYDKVMRFSTVPRLLREKELFKYKS